ncbi:AbrB/MazE/SpoVT family DNA-binding domain-containing protein [Candidatus Woesearchaeota archaeon]|nr:AbrB/MazE/SpoVT family DNA-binding domain-containing protein [Candidatus Woesearchaeota archaeon]
MIETEVKKWGNSLGIVLPADAVREMGLKQGDQVVVDVTAKKRVDGFGMAKGAAPYEEEPFEHEDLG